MQNNTNLDKIALKILQISQKEQGRAGLSNVDLASKVSLSPSPCLRRVKQLEEEGVIRERVALLSAEHLGLGLQVFIQVAIHQTQEARETFAQTIQEWEQVLGCFALSGDTDYLLHAYFTDMNAFSHFLLNELLALDYVKNAQSSFVLKEVKNSTALPLSHLNPLE